MKQVQQTLRRDPFAGDLDVLRGRAGSLAKIIGHGFCLVIEFTPHVREALHFTRAGPQWLDQWLEQNAAVCWIDYPEP